MTATSTCISVTPAMPRRVSTTEFHDTHLLNYTLQHLDMARFHAALAFMPSGFLAGVWMGVGGELPHDPSIPLHRTH